MDHGGPSPCCENSKNVESSQRVNSQNFWKSLADLLLPLWKVKFLCDGGRAGEVKLILPIASGPVSSHCLYCKRPEWTLSNGDKYKVSVLTRNQWLKQEFMLPDQALEPQDKKMPFGNGSYQEGFLNLAWLVSFLHWACRWDCSYCTLVHSANFY